MSDEHDHDRAYGHPAPVTPDDAGSQALAEALRSSFAIVKFVMLLMVVVFFGSGFFTVGPQEKAVILRFGKPVREGQKILLGAGLHWSFPYPIDEVVKIPITEIQKVSSTVGWYLTTPEQELSGHEPPPGASLIRRGRLCHHGGPQHHSHPRHTLLPHRRPDPLCVWLCVRVQHRSKRAEQRPALHRRAFQGG